MLANELLSVLETMPGNPPILIWDGVNTGSLYQIDSAWREDWALVLKIDKTLPCEHCKNADASSIVGGTPLCVRCERVYVEADPKADEADSRDHVRREEA
jgi:hypothetical protein